MSMNANELKSTARQMTIAALMPVLQENEAVKFADASFAILQTVDGQEVWTEVSVKSKAYKPTKVSPAFDPYEVAAAWEEEKRIKADAKAAKDAEKAAKVAKAKAKKEEGWEKEGLRLLFFKFVLIRMYVYCSLQ